MSDQTHETGQGAQRYVVSATNPNPTESCACYPGGHGEDSGGPFVIWTASEPIDAPHTVTCASCVIGACRALAGEQIGAGNEPRAIGAYQTLAIEQLVADSAHVNPAAETLAEAHRLLEQRDELAEDPVI